MKQWQIIFQWMLLSLICSLSTLTVQCANIPSNRIHPVENPLPTSKSQLEIVSNAKNSFLRGNAFPFKPYYPSASSELSPVIANVYDQITQFVATIHSDLSHSVHSLLSSPRRKNNLIASMRGLKTPLSSIITMPLVKESAQDNSTIADTDQNDNTDPTVVKAETSSHHSNLSSRTIIIIAVVIPFGLVMVVIGVAIYVFSVKDTGRDSRILPT